MATLFTLLPSAKAQVHFWRMRIFTAVLISCSLAISAMAQNQPFQTWFTYNHHARVTDKWGYTFDGNYRTRGVLPFTSSLTALRVGGVYQLNSALRITAGYAWFGIFVSNRNRVWLHENRIYQQIQQNKIRNGLQIMQRIRLEQRLRQEFIKVTSDETQVAFTFRARYLFQVGGPLLMNKPTQKPLLTWQAANEIFLHAGQNLNGSYFDQNRTLVGLLVGLAPSVDLAVLYQFILQRQPLLQTTQPIHSVRFTLFHTLDAGKNTGK